ncbi:hypothetical protein Pint_25684 [Pistacia integerrima]|uniref:Uncharacterized protein n=1 Tax=Pistacia integerrima TaxID=434235 RepID=A0ACC0YCH1_9ROSI|nr:hypothetical protein Pint_25684 [Pistacia integerrima]
MESLNQETYPSAEFHCIALTSTLKDHLVFVHVAGLGYNSSIDNDKAVVEKFKEVPFSPSKSLRTSLGCFGGWLCANRFGKYSIEVWIMKEYGMTESWIKLAKLPFALGFYNSPHITPLSIAKDGDEVILDIDGENMASLDDRTRELNVLFGHEHGLRVAYYEQSLVSPNMFQEAEDR